MLKQVRRLALRGNAMLLNLHGLIPESFVGKVRVELLALSENEAVIRIRKVST